MLLIAMIVLFLTSACLWLLMHRWSQRYFSHVMKPKRVLFVTAHPDDECMFFTPSIAGILQNYYTRADELVDHPSDYVFVLCLSTGNYDGLGSKRQVELMRSCIELGVWEDNIYVLDHASLQDGPDTKWDRNTISSILSDFCIQHGIELIITFDEFGVSGHPNHCAVYQGVEHYLQSSGSSSSSRRQRTVQGYRLKSVSLLRKYIAFLDAWTLLPSFIWTLLRADNQKSRKRRRSIAPDPTNPASGVEPLASLRDESALSFRSRDYIVPTPEPSDYFSGDLQLPSDLIFVGGPTHFIMGQSAMFRHQTQLLWFRRLYIFFSRYMFLNTLTVIPSHKK